jgi:cytoskeleton protein RodZ
MDTVVEDTLIGEVLRKARDAQKLTVEDVASRLHLSIKQINALEQDDFAVFGSAMLVRGFIKSYARLLSLDSEPLIEAHRNIAPQDQFQAIAYQSDNIVSVQAPSFSKFNALLLFALIVLGVVIVTIYQYMSHQDNTVLLEKPVPANAPQNTLVDSLPEAALPAAERDTNVDSTVTEVALPKSADSVVSQTQKPADKLVAKNQVVEQVKPEAIKSEPVKSEPAQSGTVRVKLVLTAPSWISVQDKTGKTVFSKLANTGASDYVEGVPPLKFHIGNVSGTQLIYNGQPVDLSANTNNNIARITLGDH